MHRIAARLVPTPALSNRLRRYLQASLLGPLLAAVLGCSSALISTAAAGKAVTMTGNWQIDSAPNAAVRLPLLSGELTGTSTSFTGLLHTRGAGTCISPDQTIAVSGSANGAKVVTLGGAVAGGTLKITGNLSDDGQSITNASYSVTGGPCAFGSARISTAQSFSPITGNYVASFVDPDGDTFAVDASLTQTPSSDTSGNFQLSGTATFPSNACFHSPVMVSNTQVTGGSFDLTYSDSTTGNSVEALGTFTPDGNTLNVTRWTLTGPCGPNGGTGSLTKR